MTHKAWGGPSLGACSRRFGFWGGSYHPAECSGSVVKHDQWGVAEQPTTGRACLEMWPPGWARGPRTHPAPQRFPSPEESEQPGFCAQFDPGPGPLCFPRLTSEQSGKQQGGWGLPTSQGSVCGVSSPSRAWVCAPAFLRSSVSSWATCLPHEHCPHVHGRPLIMLPGPASGSSHGTNTPGDGRNKAPTHQAAFSIKIL